MISDEVAFAARVSGGMIAGGVGIGQIDDAQAALGVRFPAPYRSFLTRFGAVQAPSIGVFGLVPESGPADEAEIWDLAVDVTLDLRRMGQRACLEPNASRSRKTAWGHTT